MWQVSCTFLVLIKFHELCYDFHRQVNILGEFGTNTPHVLRTAEPPGPTEPADAADRTPWHDSGPKHPHSLEHNLDEHDSLKKCQFDQMVEARITWINGSTFPIAQLPQPSSRGDPRRPQTQSLHHTTLDRVGGTYQLVCRAKPT
jgi:hypothetical protein